MNVRMSTLPSCSKTIIGVFVAVGVAFTVACQTDFPTGPKTPSDPLFGQVDECENQIPDEPLGMAFGEALAICHEMQGIAYGGVCDDMYNNLIERISNGSLTTSTTIDSLGQTYHNTSRDTWTNDPNATITIKVFDDSSGSWLDELARILRHEWAHAGLNLRDFTQGQIPKAEDWAIANCW